MSAEAEHNDEPTKRDYVEVTVWPPIAEPTTPNPHIHERGQLHEGKSREYRESVYQCKGCEQTGFWLWWLGYEQGVKDATT